MEAEEKREFNRLSKLYKNIPAKKKALAQGLISEAARLRVRLDKLWADICENGETEPFSQGDGVPYDRERPTSRIYTSTNKNYQSIIKQLNDMLPAEEAPISDKLGDFLSGK